MSLTKSRRRLLEEVYAPFSKLRKGSEEYKKLALSGRVWEDYFQPGNSKKMGYIALQHVSSHTYESRALNVGQL